MKKRLFILPVCGVMLLAAACSTSSSSDATTAAAPAASSDGEEADFSFTWLPTEGGSDTVANLLGGNCDAGFAAPTTVNQYVKSGDLKMLAITGEEAVSSAEGVPLFSDEGYPLTMTQYRGFYVNSKTDPAICQAISDMMREASQTDSFKQYMADQMLDDGYMNMQEFTDYALADYDAINELSSQLLQ